MVYVLKRGLDTIILKFDAADIAIVASRGEEVECCIEVISGNALFIELELDS